MAKLPPAQIRLLWFGRCAIFRLTVSSTQRILAIDSDSTTLASVKGMLESEDRVVDLASTAEEAKAALNAEPYDLVIADLQMPRLSGQELFDLCETRAAGSGRKILFLTAGALSPELQAFLERTKRACLPKPIHLRRFLDRVEDILSGVEEEELF